MLRVVVRHVVQSVLTVLAVSLVMFVVLFLGPNPLEQLRADPQYTPGDVDRIAHQLGWDRPWWSQYLHWLGGVLHGDLGTSYLSHRPIVQLVAERLPVTLLLTGSAMLVSLLVAVPLGLWQASRRDSVADRAVSWASFAATAMPNFVIALSLQLGSLQWLYATGHLAVFTAGAPTSHAPLEWARRLALPVLTLSIMQVARWTRYQRAEAIDAMDAEHLLAAEARGLSRRALVLRHVLPNSLLPVVTVVAIDVAGLLGGAIVVERVFDLPGMGSLLLTAVTSHDVVLALDLVCIGVVVMVAANALADVVSGMIDPRVREEAGA